MRYYDIKICTKEIPDELSLGISITGCDIRCSRCHSSHIWDSTKGTILDDKELNKLILKHKFISCVLFFGGEWDRDQLVELLIQTKLKYKLNTALYSGKELDFFENKPYMLKYLDYLKVGPYKQDKGGLDCPNTNQRLYKIEKEQLKDITDIFWKLDNK